MKRLPIARAEFKSFTTENFCYVDKTHFIKQLSEKSNKYIFLSRPRRFGKSLFVDTLRAAYAGEKELFKDTFIENNWDWSTKHPVITINFGSSNVATKEELRIVVQEKIYTNSENYEIKLMKKSSSGLFEELIQRLYEKYNKKVVVLIDEYDKPLLDNISNTFVKEIRTELAGFYSALKDAEKYLKLVFITGVSKFSKTSIFSKLNNLSDISLDPNFADICGYTQQDLETVFADYLKDVDLKKVKDWYDGYNFLGNDLYNPYSILLFLESKRYKAHWFETGTPTFLLELLEKRKFYLPQLEKVKLSETQLGEFDIDRIDFVALLFQTGYLSIKSEEEFGIQTFYNLRFPNKEVRFGFNEYLLRMLYTEGADSSQRSELYQQIYSAIADNKPQDLEKTFFSFFASIPSDWYRKNNISEFEGFYSSMFYAFFAAQGFHIIPEDFTNKGRIDLTVSTETGIFIFEYKMKKQKKNALQQIKDKKYAEKYMTLEKEIFLIGIEFDEEKRNISQFECEKKQ